MYGVVRAETTLPWVPQQAANVAMKTTSAAKSLKTFSCAEMRDKTAIGDNTILTRVFNVKNL